jgi:hypothetical protein
MSKVDMPTACDSYKRKAIVAFRPGIASVPPYGWVARLVGNTLRACGKNKTVVAPGTTPVVCHTTPLVFKTAKSPSLR